MPVKGLILGLFGGLLICAAAYPNDYLVESNLFVGNHLPVATFFLLFLFCLLIRPVLNRAPAAFRVTNRDITVAVIIMLAACSLPTSSLMRYFPTMLTVPYDLFATRQHWQTNKALSFTPRKLVPEGWYIEGEDPELDRTLTAEQRRERTRRAESVNKGLRNGIVSGNRFVGFWPSGSDGLATPLKSWLPLLRYWGPAILLFLAMIIGIIGVMHPQWSRNELLPYPIADFTTSMLHVEGKRLFPAIFYKRVFWVGFGTVAFIHFIRWVYRWYPDTMINIPLEWRLWPISGTYPNFFHHAYWSWNIVNGNIKLSVVAFAFFIPTDVSFSLGIGVFAVAFFSYLMWTFGYSYSTYHHTSTLFGAYVGMFLIILYLGRRYYWNVFKTALFLRTTDPVDRHIQLAARTLLAATVGLIACCMAAGLSLFYSLVLVTVFAILFVVLARMVAETGNICVQSWWKPIDLIFKLFGAAAMGPYTLSVMSLISTPLCVDARECLSCFMINSMKLSDTEKVPKFRLGAVVAAVLIPGMLVAFLSVLWVNYNGRHAWDGWSHGAVPRQVFDRVTTCVSTLEREPKLFDRVMQVERGEANPLRALAFRLGHIKTAPGVLPWVIAGFAAVLLCSWLRLRYAWWFIHPVLFLYWGTPPAVWFSWSFLFGSVIKAAVVRYGGGRVYHDLKPFFIGAIMGELAAVGVMMVFNVVYFFTAGVEPVRFFVFPR